MLWQAASIWDRLLRLGEESYRLMHASDPVDVPGQSPNDTSNLSTSPPMESFCAVSPPSFYIPTKSDDMPVALVPGEKLEEATEFLSSRVYVTNYRLVIVYDRSSRGQNIAVESIPKVNVDTVDNVGTNQLSITCKDTRVIRLTCATNEQACTWWKKMQALSIPSVLNPRPPASLFAFTVVKHLADLPIIKVESEPEWIFDEKKFFDRIGLDPDYFQIVDYNSDFSICSSYPKNLIIPKDMDRKDIESLRDYRMLGRIPAIAWHSTEKKTVLLRASQPRCSFFAWRSAADEKFLRLVNEYTNKMRDDNGGASLRIYDCRSYAAAFGNRIKGGGYEREENYTNMKIEFCSLSNIHAVKLTFIDMRNLFVPPVDQTSFLTSLEMRRLKEQLIRLKASATEWFNNILNLLQYANQAAESLIDKGVNVMIHCSDGWDRTTQIITLVKILVDPYYRTMKGMEELIRRDWIGYGHKFSDRNGVSGQEVGEKCPIFLQWLDALHQIYSKYSTEFEYSMAYLVKLACHVSSGFFSSFCFNTVQEMQEACEKDALEPFPIWRLLNSDISFVNALYDPDTTRATRIVAPDNIQSMKLWNEMYRVHEVDSLLRNPNEEERNNSENRGTTTGSAMGEREVKETPVMERSLIKSRSTESLTSTSESHILPSNTSQHRLSENLESEGEVRERRNTRSSLGNEGIVVSAPVTTVSASPDPKTTFDFDGLFKFVDKTQESARKKFQIHEDALKKKKEIADRKRLKSEMSDISIRDDSETFVMDDLQSDASIIDEHEVNSTPRNYGTQMNATHCSVCRHTFGYIKQTKSNCDSCGRAVCDRCSCHSYKETVDGVAKNRRACKECYSKMNSSPLSSPARSCPDGETQKNVGYVSPSQAVKG